MEKSIHRLDPNNMLKGQIEITITDEGLRIELMESEKGTFFELGSPVPTPALTELLQVLSSELSQLPNRISIEGHTDSKPYSQIKTYDNWDLSSDRANAARRLMQQEGIRSDQIRLPQDPENPSNRRISLIVQYASQTGGEVAPIRAELQSKNVAAPK